MKKSDEMPELKPFELSLDNGDWVVTNGDSVLFRHTDKACLIRRMIDRYVNTQAPTDDAKRALDEFKFMDLLQNVLRKHAQDVMRLNAGGITSVYRDREKSVKELWDYVSKSTALSQPSPDNFPDFDGDESFYYDAGTGFFHADDGCESNEHRAKWVREYPEDKPSPDVIGEVVELLDCWKGYSSLREDVAQERYPDIRSSTDKALEKLK